LAWRRPRNNDDDDVDSGDLAAQGRARDDQANWREEAGSDQHSDGEDSDEYPQERHAYRPELEARGRGQPYRGGTGDRGEFGGGFGLPASSVFRHRGVVVDLRPPSVAFEGASSGGSSSSAEANASGRGRGAGAGAGIADRDGGGGARARGLLEDSDSDSDYFDALPSRRDAQDRGRRQAFDSDDDGWPPERPNNSNTRALMLERTGAGLRVVGRPGGGGSLIGAGGGGRRHAFGDELGDERDGQAFGRVGLGRLLDGDRGQQRYGLNPLDRRPFAYRPPGGSLFDYRRPAQPNSQYPLQAIHQSNRQRGLVSWGSALMLRKSCASIAQRTELCVCPVLRFKVPNRDGIAGSDAEIFEPVICVQRGRGSPKVFHGRVAARRGIWIGGTAHFDDFTVHGEHGAAALIVFNPQTSRWRLYPGAASQLCIMAEVDGAPDGDGDGKALRKLSATDISTSDVPVERVPVRVGAQGILLPKLAETVVRLHPQGPHLDLVLEPVYVARRWSEAAGVTMPEVATTQEEAQRLRERVVLIMFRSTVGASTMMQQGAVMTDFSIGRGEACNLRFSDVLSISRSHCMLSLDDVDSDDQGAEPKLVVYDEGSLSGTTLIDADGVDRDVGVGRTNAIPIAQGDCLRLGGDVTMCLTAVSRRLRLDDPDGLAEFFDSVGEVGTAQTLRQEPRLSEAIVSFAMSSVPMRFSNGRYSPNEERGSNFDEVPWGRSSDSEY